MKTSAFTRAATLFGFATAIGPFVVATAPALAQNTGSLRGTVTDTTGAIVPGATLTLTNEGTKFTRTAVSDAKGGFFFASVDPGVYRLKAEVAGFKTQEIKGLRMSANDTLGVEMKVEVGQQTETVEVTAGREMIQSETGSREGIITPESIENISMVGRNPLELLRTLPGVVTPEQSSFEKAGIGEGFGNVNTPWAINGARPQNLAVTIDGANLRDIGNNSGMMNVPNNEFVAEVKVQMSNYAAEFGTSAVNVQAVTKSGSAVFHGSGYYYLRDDSMAANDRSRNYANLTRPPEKYQYPGFTFGGPILIPGTGFNKNRDKAFFFVGWEWQRQTTAPDPRFGVVPTAGMRQGVFNDYQSGQHLNLPTSVNIPKGFPGAGTPAANNDLSPYIDPIGRALMGLWPQPNYNDPNNRYNYIFNPLIDANRNQGVVRLDYNITDSTRAYIRYARDSELNQNARGLWWGPGDIELPTPIDGSGKGQSAVFNLTSVLSPTTTNEFLFTWSRLKLDNRFDDPSKMDLATIGAGGLENPFGGSGIVPDMVMEFDSSESLWFAQDVDNIFAYNGFLRFGDSFTKVMNTHALKVGGIVERQYKEQNFQLQNNIQLNFAPWGNGEHGQRVRRPARGTPGLCPGGPTLGGRELRRLEHGVLRPGFLEGHEELHARVRPALRQVDEQRGEQRHRRHLPGPELRPERGLPRRLRPARERLGLRGHRRCRPEPHRFPALPLHAARELRLGSERERQHRAPGRRRHLLQPRAGQRPVRRHQDPAECVQHRRSTPGPSRTSTTARG